jgi:hypothetical protein
MLIEIAHLLLHRVPCARRCVVVPQGAPAVLAVGFPRLTLHDSMNHRHFSSNRLGGLPPELIALPQGRAARRFGVELL